MRFNKFGNKKTVVDGITFDSKKESERYKQLLLLQKAGEIQSLELQPKFRLSIDGRPVLIRSEGYPNGRQASYSADFRYLDLRRKQMVVEDCKSPATKTALYKLKKAIVECAWPGTIVEEV